MRLAAKIGPICLAGPIRLPESTGPHRSAQGLSVRRRTLRRSAGVGQGRSHARVVQHNANLH